MNNAGRYNIYESVPLIKWGYLQCFYRTDQIFPFSLFKNVKTESEGFCGAIFCSVKSDSIYAAAAAAAAASPVVGWPSARTSVTFRQEAAWGHICEHILSAKGYKSEEHFY